MLKNNIKKMLLNYLNDSVKNSEMFFTRRKTCEKATFKKTLNFFLYLLFPH